MVRLSQVPKQLYRASFWRVGGPFPRRSGSTLNATRLLFAHFPPFA